MAQPPPITLDPSSPAFDSADDAASALALTFGDPKALAEKAGVILKGPDGKFRYTTTVGGQDDSFALRAQIPKDHTFAGIIHSHPGTDSFGTVFSPDDLQVAQKLKVPSYVRFAGDGGVRRYVAGETKTRTMPNPTSRMPYVVADGDALTPPVLARNDDVTNH